MGIRRHVPKAAPDGLIAAVLLSFLATAGFFYVNIMPAMIDALVTGLRFSEGQAGSVASANVYGASLGALLAAALVRFVPWRPLSLVALAGLIALDLASMAMHQLEALVIVRSVHGVIGGILVGTAFAVIARTKTPDRVFGMLLVVQFGLGGLGVMYLPRLVPLYGPPVIFLALAAFSIVTIAMLPFLAAYPAQEERDAAAPRIAAPWGLLVLALLAIFLFQAGNMALAGYMIGLGRAFALQTEFITSTLGLASWIGAVGSVLVIVLSTRLGRFWPILIAFIPTLAGNAAFHFSYSADIFLLANVGTAITWAFIIPYLLGICASFDRTGQSAALSSFSSHMGLATGPLLGGMLLGGGDYRALINVAVIALAASAIAALIPAFKLDFARSSRAKLTESTT